MSIIVGVADGAGPTVGFIVMSGIGDEVVGGADGSIVMLGIGEPGAIVIPGIGAIVASGDGWAASTICGAIKKTKAAETFKIEQ